MGDLRKVVGVEQAGLQRPVVAGQGRDGGALNTVIQSMPSHSRSSLIRVVVIIPRSPTRMIFSIPKSSRTRVTAVVKDTASGRRCYQRTPRYLPHSHPADDCAVALLTQP